MQQNQPEYHSLIQEIELLKAENIRLKDLLKANGIAYEPVMVVSAEEKEYSDITFPDAHLGKDDRVASVLVLEGALMCGYFSKTRSLHIRHEDWVMRF